jgi:hypothetical protein
MGLFLAKQYINSEEIFTQTDTTYTAHETTEPVIVEAPKVQRTWIEKILYGYK